MSHSITDWTDATRPMRSAVHDALQRLREAIDPGPRERITQPTLMSPYLLELERSETAELHTQIEKALDELQA